jgi:arylsulfatase B
MQPYEGGTRTAAFLAGGYLPKNLCGTSSDAFVHVADWYATLSVMVGVDPSDTARCTHDIDGIDVWPMITRTNLTNPREYPTFFSSNCGAVTGKIQMRQ